MRKIGLPGRARVLGYALVMVGPVGCSDDRVRLPGVDSSTGEPSSSSTTTSGSSSTSAASSTGRADDTAGTTGPASTGEPEVIFVPELDAGNGNFECDPFAQDCPSGQKCLPWITVGGSWATRCSPVAENPAAVGEPCHAEHSFSGIDDCEFGAMCWNVDPKTNEGVCFAQCVGSWDAWICEDPDHQCFLSSVTWEAGLALCHPVCDPLAQDCLDGEVCVPWQHSGGWSWVCGPDASGEAGAYGDPCEYINMCDPGLICLDASTAPSGLPCEGAAGCCLEICDLDDPLGDMQCAGAAEGQVCLPWYEDGEAEPGYEDVGVCTLP